jgi:predicted ester cyclase
MEMRRTVERYVEIHQSGDPSNLAEIIDPEFRYRLGSPVGVAGVAAGMQALHAGFSDLACALEQCVCGGDWAAFRFVIEGTHTGVFSGRAPTGRRLRWSGADFVRFRGSKIVELWNVSDSLPLMEGIGAVIRSSDSRRSE